MVKLKVEEMSCGHCAASVDTAVRSVDPAAEVAVDLKTGIVAVTSAADAVRIGEAIRAAGYPATAMAE